MRFSTPLPRAGTSRRVPRAPRLDGAGGQGRSIVGDSAKWRGRSLQSVRELCKDRLRKNVLLRTGFRKGHSKLEQSFLRLDSTGTKNVPDLHAACEHCESLTKLRSVFENSVQTYGARESCSRRDPTRRGCLPLHCIGLNVELVLMSGGETGNSSAQVDEFIFSDLIAAHPAAVIEETHDGKIPFTRVLFDFVRARRAIRRWRAFVNNKKKRPKMMNVVMSALEKESFGNVDRQNNSEERREDEDYHSANSDFFTGPLPGPATSDSTDFQRSDLPPLVEWSLRMLSSIIERSSSLSGRSWESLQGGPEQNGSSRRRSNGLYPGSHLDFSSAVGHVYSDTIVEKVAAIPNLLQELLLLRDEAARSRVFDLVLIKRVLLSEASFGNWSSCLTSMVQKGVGSENKIPSREWSRPFPWDYAEAAVYYLERISLDPFHAAVGRKGSEFALISETTSSAHGDFRKKRDACFRRVCDVQMIPNLTLLSDDLAERVAATCCIQELLDEVMAWPVVSTVFAGDVIIHGLAIIALRCGPTNALMHVVSKEVSFDPSGYILWCSVLHVSLAYLFMREFSKIVAKRSISSLLMWTSLSDAWTILDLAWPFLCFFVSLAIDYQLHALAQVDSKGSGSVDAPYLRIAVAITTGTLWLKLLNIIKFLNRHLATFILCLFQLIKDIKWFLFIILLVMVAFSQMFLPLLGPELSYQPDAMDDLLHAYVIFLGDFDSAKYSGGPLSVFFVLYTFIVSIVLLNILIAIVSNCYEKALVSSRILFGKVRLGFTCSLMSQHFYLQRKVRNRKPYVILQAFYTIIVAVLSRTTLKTAKVKAIQAQGMAENEIARSIIWLEIQSSLLLMFVVVIFWFIVRLREASYKISVNMSQRKGFTGVDVSFARPSMTNSLNQYVFALQSFVIQWLGKSEKCDGLNEPESVPQKGEALSIIHGNLESIRDQIAADSRESTRRFKEALDRSKEHTDQEVDDLEERLTESLAEAEKRIASIVAASEDRITSLLRELIKKQKIS